jgi:hypothetical protein
MEWNKYLFDHLQTPVLSKCHYDTFFICLICIRLGVTVWWISGQKVVWWFDI